MLKSLLPAFVPDPIELVFCDLADELKRHFSTILQNAARIVYPLPDLLPLNLSGGGIFHQIVKRHTAQASQPGFDVLNTNPDIHPQSFFGD